MQRASWALVVVGLVAGGCRRPRDPRAVERLVPASRSVPATPPEAVVRPTRHPAPVVPRSDAAVVRPITDRPPPAGVLGTRWGTPREELEAAQRAAHVTCNAADDYLFCRRALVPVAVDAVTTYEFCGGRLCSVALDGPRTRDEDALQRHFEQLLELMRGELGAPVVEARRVTPGCRGHLALCLGSRGSELSARWNWPDGSQVMLSADPLEDDALTAQVSVTCLSAERARMPEPAPAVVAPDAAGTPEGGVASAP